MVLIGRGMFLIFAFKSMLVLMEETFPELVFAISGIGF